MVWFRPARPAAVKPCAGRCYSHLSAIARWKVAKSADHSKPPAKTRFGADGRRPVAGGADPGKKARHVPSIENPAAGLNAAGYSAALLLDDREDTIRRLSAAGPCIICLGARPSAVFSA
jgi:hypothetical protein